MFQNSYQGACQNIILTISNAAFLLITLMLKHRFFATAVAVIKGLFGCWLFHSMHAQKWRVCKHPIVIPGFWTAQQTTSLIAAYSPIAVGYRAALGPQISLFFYSTFSHKWLVA